MAKNNKTASIGQTVTFGGPDYISSNFITTTEVLRKNVGFPYGEYFSVLEAIQFLIKEYIKKGIQDNEIGQIRDIEDFFSSTVVETNILPSETNILTGSGGGIRINLEVLVNAKNKAERIELNNRALSLIGTRVFQNIVNQIPFGFWDILQQAQDLLKTKKEVEKELAEIKKKEGRKHTKIALHTVSQFYGDNKQLSVFSDDKIDDFSKSTGLSITNRPDSYGVVLNQAQDKVFEGILKAFSDTNYKGDNEVDKLISLKEIMNTGSGAMREAIKKPYQNIDKIPVVRLTQAEIIELSGYDLKSQRQGDKVDVIEAITFLATKQFCFYWVRLKTEEGKPVKDKNGDWVKEEVMEVGSLFRIKTVRAEEGELQYYEIHPSAPLLDQVNNHFLLVPNNWRDEVKRITGKRASSYTYKFLLWLRREYERIRMYNNGGGKNRKPKPFRVSKSWEDVAIALKMPETMYKANRKRAFKIIQEAYSIAIKLDYLVKVENNGATDVLYLNESYYPKPGELI
jgi:hypothetical protein